MCPKCNHNQICPCESCNNPKELKPWIWITGDGPIACGNCGFTETVDYWFDRDWEYHKEDMRLKALAT